MILIMNLLYLCRLPMNFTILSSRTLIKFLFSFIQSHASFKILRFNFHTIYIVFFSNPFQIYISTVSNHFTKSLPFLTKYPFMFVFFSNLFFVSIRKRNLLPKIFYSCSILILQLDIDFVKYRINL